MRRLLAPILAKQLARLFGCQALGEAEVERLAGGLEQDHELHVLDAELVEREEPGEGGSEIKRKVGGEVRHGELLLNLVGCGRSRHVCRTRSSTKGCLARGGVAILLPGRPARRRMPQDAAPRRADGRVREYVLYTRALSPRHGARAAACCGRG